MRIRLSSIFVDSQEKALRFYTDILGFVKMEDMRLGDARWLTVVSPDENGGAELVLEPDNNPALNGAMTQLKRALVENRIPFTAFEVADIHRECEQLKSLGVVFSQEPESAGPVTVAAFDDTCGNLIQIYQVNRAD